MNIGGTLKDDREGGKRAMQARTLLLPTASALHRERLFDGFVRRLEPARKSRHPGFAWER